MIKPKTLKTLYEKKGLSIKDIAKRLGTTYYDVHNSLVVAGIPRRGYEKKRQKFFKGRGHHFEAEIWSEFGDLVAKEE